MVYVISLTLRVINDDEDAVGVLPMLLIFSTDKKCTLHTADLNGKGPLLPCVLYLRVVRGERGAAAAYVGRRSNVCMYMHAERENGEGKKGGHESRHKDTHTCSRSSMRPSFSSRHSY